MGKCMTENYENVKALSSDQDLAIKIEEIIAIPANAAKRCKVLFGEFCQTYFSEANELKELSHEALMRPDVLRAITETIFLLSCEVSEMLEEIMAVSCEA